MKQQEDMQEEKKKKAPSAEKPSAGDAEPDAARAETEQDSPVARAEFDRVVAELDVATKEAVRQAARAEEMTLAAQRLQADFDNFRRRNADAVGRARKDGESDVLTAFLPALDVFDSALKMIDDDGIAQGVRMIRKQILDTLAGFGVEAVPALGETFDPEFHNAIEQVAADDAQSGTVVEVLQQGYRRGDKILRHALVKVAQ